MKKPLIILLFCGLFSAPALAGMIAPVDSMQCPSGYRLILNNVCLADELDDLAVMPAGGRSRCELETHSNPPGVNFCLLKRKVSLAYANGMYFVNKAKSSVCAAGFSWWDSQQICRADELVLSLVNNKLKLVRATNKSGLVCALGYMQPEHMQICLQNKVAFETSIGINFGLDVPTAVCGPDYTSKRQGFCVPKRTLFMCGEDTFPCLAEDGDLFRAVAGRDRCAEYERTAVFHMPVFNSSASLDLTMVPNVLCAPTHGKNLH